MTSTFVRVCRNLSTSRETTDECVYKKMYIICKMVSHHFGGGAHAFATDDSGGAVHFPNVSSGPFSSLSL